MPTRWSATYLMLKRAQESKAALNQFASRHCHEFVLSDEEWAALEEICEYLAEFDKSSVFLSAVSYPIRCPNQPCLSSSTAYIDELERLLAPLQETERRG